MHSLNSMKLRQTLTALTAVFALNPLVQAEEGMWLYSNPPRQQLREKYGFEITDSWLDHLMKSSVRFNIGSGSFVSGDGLVLTNHHVGADALQKFSTQEHNYLRDGFHARSAAEEIKCVDLELNVLQNIEDVTTRVNAAIPIGITGGEAALARRKIFAEIEKESLDKTGFRSDVVTLYRGGEYHLYRFKRYTDVRLVFAPEAQAAFFGGDPDNFEYPRYNLDICFFRVYENDRPVQPVHFLRWSAAGAAEGELVFVSGHPGSTRRSLTIPELEYSRDTLLPFVANLLKRREVLLLSWSERSQENARRAKEELFSLQNTRKVDDGRIAALQDPVFFGAKVAAEEAFKQQLAARSDGAAALAAYAQIADAQKSLAGISLRYRFLEGGFGLNAGSFEIARALLRAGDERPKPNGARLSEYADAKRESFELDLFSDKPVYPDFETLTLADSLTSMVEQLGAEDPTVKAILAGQSPRARAADLINRTRVREVALRKKLYEGGASAVAAANDPMIELARLIDREARELRKIAEAQDEIKKQAQAAISKMRFAIQGTGNYPDATGTLRLSYGTVKGYAENGAPVPAMTNLAGLYARSAEQNGKFPFNLPPRWIARKSALDLTVPFNFVSTNDTISGNSGSPVVNRAAEVVGIYFDGNIQSLSEDYGYSDVQSRALSVHSAGILEALRKVYEDPDLVNELVKGKR